MPQLDFSTPVHVSRSARETFTHWCGKTIKWEYVYNGVQEWPLFYDGISHVCISRCPQCDQKLTTP